MASASTQQEDAASNRFPRHINRNLIFRLIRLHQPISRAELARRSGLKRSTVSLIVEELIQEQWVIEAEMAAPARGRRAQLIRFNEHRGVIGLDIHPARTSISVADLSGKVGWQNVIPLTLDMEGAMAAIVSGISEVIRSRPEMSFIGIGLCLPGRTDLNLEKLVFAPRLQWPQIDIRGLIHKETGLHVEIDNVANACALAEVWFGDSKASDTFAVVNVSEGISVGVYAAGRVVRGHRGMAGEMGHVQIAPEEGILCACGRRGCWETLASNTAALRYHRELAGVYGAPSYELLVSLALAGQTAAVEALKRAAVELGKGIGILLAGLSLKEVIVVGEIARAWSLLGPTIDRESRNRSMTPPETIRCRDGDEDARLRGAISLLLSRWEL